MGVKSVLCICEGVPEDISCLHVSLALAKAQAAQLRILHITPALSWYINDIMDTMSDTVISEAIEVDNQEKLDRAKQFSAHYAALHHVPLNMPDAPKHHASAQFLHRAGIVEDIVAEEGRLSDVIVVGRGTNEVITLFNDSLLAALFDTGRPVLVAPYMQGPQPREWEHKIIVLLWNGSLESARALYNAMPFLEKAEKVHILMAHDPSEAGSMHDGAKVMEYLRAHDVTANVVILDRGKSSLESTLYIKAKELNADFMVMGAYGHSRTREMILGGVTRYMLARADIPLLLSH
jgi:nucleotide-binding universal stress UspA family protein